MTGVTGQNAGMRATAIQAIRRAQPPGGSAGSILSIGSTGSILSISSAGSILSIGSAGSILSIGSAGSLASVLSVGSAASVLSIMSAGARASIRGARRPGDHEPEGGDVARPADATGEWVARGTALAQACQPW